MKDFILVFKVLFKNQNARRIANDGRRKLPQQVKTLLCMLPLTLLICVVAGLMAVIIPTDEELSLVSNVIVSAVQLLTLFVSMFSIMNTLYNSPDTPFLNTLPVSHTSVFFAKFAVCYLNALTFSASLMIPALLTVAVVYAALGGIMMYGYFALIFLVALVAPVLPLFIITLFSMPLSYIGTFFKGKAVLKTVLSLLFYVAIMIGYLLIIYYARGSDDLDGDISGAMMSGSALSGLGVFAKVMYPNKVLLDFCLGLDAGKNFGISFGITVGMIIVMIILAMLFYRRISVRKLETHSEGSHGEIKFKQSSVIPALMKKDFKGIIRNTSIAMSSLAN
ncbi:MAG: hypothetical protein K2N18_00665, partial [Clostridia bacterium]|nr:hypothetical protein [Clostridia bacterium]